MDKQSYLKKTLRLNFNEEEMNMDVKCDNCGWSNTIGCAFCDNCGEPLSIDVFISYSRKDYVDTLGKPYNDNIITKIKETLSKNGISYWFDEDGIYSGEEFASVITQAIRTSKLFLFVSSANSNLSRWTSNEISTALEYKKIIIPFRIDDSPYNDSIMMKIVSFDRIDCKEHSLALSKLLRAIRHHLTAFYQKQKFVDNSQNARRTSGIVNVDEARGEQVLSVEEKKKTPQASNDRNLIDNKNDCKSKIDKHFVGDITINISDIKTPILIPIGPSGIGKTMTLIRLMRFLTEQGYSINPESSFRSIYDLEYRMLCDDFMEMVQGEYAAPRTSISDCILININNKNKKILQILDYPGDSIMCFGSKQAPAYLFQIFNSENPIIWLIMTELEWSDLEYRLEYVDIIKEIKKQYFSIKDKIIIVANKIDESNFLEGKAIVNFSKLFNQIQLDYPGLIDLFKNSNPITILWKPYNCSIIPFSSGRYITKDKNSTLFVPSPKEFPLALWRKLNEIIASINIR